MEENENFGLSSSDDVNQIEEQTEIQIDAPSKEQIFEEDEEKDEPDVRKIIFNPFSAFKRNFSAKRFNDFKKKNLFSTIFVPLIICFLLLLLSVSGKILLDVISSDITPTEFFLIISIVQILIFLFPCILYYFFKGRNLNTPFLIKGIERGQMFFTISAALLLIFGNLLIKCLYYVADGLMPSNVEYMTGITVNIDDVPAFAVIIGLALIPAICEEIFFRGLVLAEYRTFGAFNAVMFSSICFAMIHFSIESFPLYLYSGIVLGYTVVVTRSVIVSIAIHFISNILSLFVSDAFLSVTMQKSSVFFGVFVVSVMFLIALVLVLSGTERYLYKMSEDKSIKFVPKRSYKNLARVFLSVGFFMIVIVFAIIMLVKN